MNRQKMIEILGAEDAEAMERYVAEGTRAAATVEVNQGMDAPRTVSAELARELVHQTSRITADSSEALD